MLMLFILGNYEIQGVGGLQLHDVRTKFHGNVSAGSELIDWGHAAMMMPQAPLSVSRTTIRQLDAA
jgi:hypothetical protein